MDQKLFELSKSIEPKVLTKDVYKISCQVSCQNFKLKNAFLARFPLKVRTYWPEGASRKLESGSVRNGFCKILPKRPVGNMGHLDLRREGLGS